MNLLQKKHICDYGIFYQLCAVNLASPFKRNEINLYFVPLATFVNH